MEDKNLFVLLSQYHGCWWPGDTGSQGISSHDMDLILSEYADVNSRRDEPTLIGDEPQYFIKPFYIQY